MYQLSLYAEKPIEKNKEQKKNKRDYFGEPSNDDQYLNIRIILIFHSETLTIFLLYEVF